MFAQSETFKRLILSVFLSFIAMITTGFGSFAAADDESAASPEPEPSAASKYPGMITHVVPVLATDPSLTSDHRAHWAYLQPGVKPRGQLLVYLPGTHNSGKAENAFNSFAAQQGYHVLSLSYICGISVAIFRKSPDPKAFLKGRKNIIYGTAPIAELQVDPANSILNRLVKALSYLDKAYPKEGWGAYLNKDQLVWSKLAFAGLSQGGGHACLLGKQHGVARVVMFGSPKDYSLYFKRPADWLSMPSQTPITCFFCFNHSLDEKHGCTYAQQVENYKALGLSQRFPIVDVDNNAPPYRHTRLLTSHRPADIPKHNHGVVVGDSNYSDAWKYLLTEPCP